MGESLFTVYVLHGRITMFKGFLEILDFFQVYVVFGKIFFHCRVSTGLDHRFAARGNLQQCFIIPKSIIEEVFASFVSGWDVLLQTTLCQPSLYILYSFFFYTSVWNQQQGLDQ